MGSDAFRSLFTLYQSRTRVAVHVDTLREGDTECTGDAEGKAVSAAAFPSASFAAAQAQVGSRTTQPPAMSAGLCVQLASLCDVCCTLHFLEVLHQMFWL